MAIEPFRLGINDVASFAGLVATLDLPGSQQVGPVRWVSRCALRAQPLHMRSHI